MKTRTRTRVVALGLFFVVPERVPADVSGHDCLLE